MAAIRPYTLIRFVVFVLAFACLGGWFTFRTYSQSSSPQNLDSEKSANGRASAATVVGSNTQQSRNGSGTLTANSPSVAAGIFLAAVEQFGVGSGSVDLFNVTLGGSGASDTFTPASPATVAVTNSTNENKPDIDNPLNALFDTSGDLLVGNGGTTTGSPQDNGSFACIPASAISTTQNSSTTISTNVDDPVGIAYDKRDGSVAFANNPTSSPVQLVEFLLNGGYSAAPTGRNLTASGYGSFGLTNLPTLPAGSYAISLTTGLENDPAHNTGSAKIAIITATSPTTSTETDILPSGAGTNCTSNPCAIPATYGIDIPHQIAWDTADSQLVIANNSAFHKLLSFYNLSGTQLFAVNTGLRNDKVAVSPDGHVAVSGTGSFGYEQVKVYDNTAARNPVGGPIPFNGTTTSCGSTYNFPQAGVNSITWLSNTKLLIALQSYNGSVASAQNGLYIYDISAMAVPSGFDDVSCSAFAAAPKQTGFVHTANKPLGTAITTPTTFAAGTGASCGSNPSCYTTLSQAIANTPAGGILNVLGGTFNESVNLNNNIIMNLDADTTVNDFTISAGSTLNGGGGFCAQANGATLTLKNNWSNGGTFNAGGGTVAFSGSAAQTIGGSNQTTFNNLTVNNTSGGVVSLGNNETVNGALTLTNGALGVGTNTLTLNGAASRTSGSLNSSANGTVNYNQASDGQAVLAANYGNLTFSNFKKTLPNGGTVGIAGVFTPGTASGHTITGSTVEFNGTSAQTLPSAFTTYNNLTLNNPAGTTGFAGLTVQGLTEVKAGTFTGNNTTAKDVQIDNAATLAGTNATIINVAGNWANNGTFTANGDTVNFNGSSIQTIGGTNATIFNNLILNNASGASLGNSQTIGGTLTLTNGTLGIGSNTLTLNGAVAFTGGLFGSNANGTVNYNQSSNGQAVVPGQYGNLTFSNFAKTLNGSSVKIAGVFTTGSGGGHTITGSTIEFNGTSAQTLPSGFTTYNNLTLNNTAGTTGFPALTVQNLLRTQAGTFTTGGTFKDVQIDAGTTLASSSAATINVSGAWTNNGTFTGGTGTVNFNGSSAAQTIGGSTAAGFNNLTLANTAGVTLGINASVNGTLLVNSNVLFNLSSFDATTVGTLTNNGTIRKTQAVSGTGAKTFGLAGRFNGANLTVNVATQGTLSSLQVDRIDSNHPNAAAPEQTNRYWIITPTGTGYSVNLTLPRDNANAPSACRYTGTGTVWDCDLSSSTANSVTRNNVTALSPWAVGDNAIIAPSIAEAFSPTTINYGGTSTVTLTLSNSNVNSLVGASFTDTLSNMSAAGGAVGGTCVGTSPNSLAAGATALSFTGITIPANSNCTITFAVTGTNVGANPNTTSGVTSTQTPAAGTQSNTANLTVNPPADLTVTKTHTGNFTQGDTAKTYTITAANSGGSPTSGTVTVVDALPSGLTATAISGTNWNCTLATLTCTRTDALAATGSYPAITLTVNVANNAASSVTNSVTVSGGAETNTSNDTASDPTTVNPAATYTISGQVTNGGAALQGVSVALSGSSSSSVTTDASGNYSFTTLTSGGNYTVTPLLNGYTFSPVNTPVNNITGNQTAVNFATSVASYEADAAPRPSGDGDGTVNGGDVTMIRRFVAGIETPPDPASGSEFQRVDCAPLYDANNVLIKGDGLINGGDITQVRRFAAGLDAVVPAGGPAAPVPPPSGNSPTNSPTMTENSALLDSLSFADNLAAAATVTTATTRDVHPVKVSQTGNVLTVAINLNTDAASTPANTVDFTLQYDTAVLSNPTNIRLGSNAPNVTTITPNTLQSGKVGIVLDLPVAGTVTTFPTGDAQLVLIDFTVAANPPAATTISFGNVPVSDFVGDIFGNTLTTTFTSAPISILGTTAATVSVSGRVVTQAGRGISGVQLSLTDSNGQTRTAVSTSFGYYHFDAVRTGETYILSANGKHYTFSQPLQVLNINEETDEVNFIANSEKKVKGF